MSFSDLGGRNNDNSNNNNGPSGAQRGVQKSASYIASFVAQGKDSRIPTKHKSCANDAFGG